MSKRLQSVSLTAEPGQITALIGPNGSGKTTLLNIVSGYYGCEHGTVRIDDATISAMAPHRRARLGVGRTFQTPIIPADLTVREVVRTGALAREVSVVETMLRLPRDFRRNHEESAIVEQVLSAMGLEHRADEEAAALPLGTRRLVELARVLVLQPAVMLLDEVASGLDQEEVAELTIVIRRLRDAGATIVLVEHNFDLVSAVADHIVVLAEGQVLATGSAADIGGNVAVKAKYLGVGPPAAPTAAEESTLQNASPEPVR